MNAPLRKVSLDDKYLVDSGRVFLTGMQALVRLPMLQRQRDQAAGLNTAGFISGYRGSPVGGMDQALWRARDLLDKYQIVFQPGVNEEVAATAVWGTQQIGLFPAPRHDGVFALWYAKGPGVDRCGDVFKHANSAGTAPWGGVLAVAGDDHLARSSTVAHQSEHAFKAAMMPVLVPANVQEVLDLGLHGWALSRYSGCWVAFKGVAEILESSASVDVSPDRISTRVPADYQLPPGGLNIRWPDERLAQEARLLDHKLYAALAYCRANRLDRVVIDSPNPRLGIITCGKSYLDVRQAFDDLGIDDALAAEIGIRLYKVGMVWPLETEGVRHFAEGLDEILVVEEKRQLIEYQLKEALYNWREDVRPRVIGKFDEKGEWALPHGHWLLPAAGELSPALIAQVIAQRIDRFFTSLSIRERLAVIEARERAAASPVAPVARIPYFCPGCPHNTSTRVPEGSQALAGIGCHFMATWMQRNTATFSHMGGEGCAWIGQSPFTERQHVFANIGDGTYFHSGILAIRASVAAFNARTAVGHTRATPAGITYKLLYNDAVAMTGGQPLDGVMTVPQLARQLAAEGVGHIVVVTDGSPRAWHRADLPHGVPVRYRDEMDQIQRELRQCPGVSALIYDQTCAAEKRRRRKRGKFPDPPVRAFINEHVCEGCGDCGVASNCLALVPVETEFGRKRAIDQSACNKDYACIDGFCPSFVTVVGGRPRRGLAQEHPADQEAEALPEPRLPGTATPYGILITGVGGTGVVTLGALVGMAAHLDGKGVTVLDVTGLAQKGGAVLSHVRIADRPADIHAVRIATGEADAVLGGDAIVTVSPEALAKMRAGRTRVVVNIAETPTADFTRDTEWKFPLDQMTAALGESVGAEGVNALDATHLATRLLGDALYANPLLLGYAWQRGLLPVSRTAIEEAMALNGAAVAMNLKAFTWGRRLATQPNLAASLLPTAESAPTPDLMARIELRARFLADYQDQAYADRYLHLVFRARAADQLPGHGGLTEAVAVNFFKLLAIKDEYEVARLYAETDFLQRVEAAFEGDYRLHFHLAPPLLARPDPSGRIRKLRFGPWMMTAFRWLAKARRWRGTVWDVFGRSAERRLERRLAAEYQADMEQALCRLEAADDGAPGELPRGAYYDALTRLAALPANLRGFGAVKLKSLDAFEAQRQTLKGRLGIG